VKLIVRPGKQEILKFMAAAHPDIAAYGYQTIYTKIYNEQKTTRLHLEKCQCDLLADNDN